MRPGTNEAKELVDHGQWQLWLRRHTKATKWADTLKSDTVSLLVNG
jgi:hypothetical protein